ncbi:MAG TPA: diaminopimelate epimerase [Pseudonocardia sp.]|nr:diaminopimelate epimerase [Pseudonocardia sp.]
MQFAKGHGTENDFVVLPDPEGALDLTPARVAALCDRRRGLGADGVLRVVRWPALGEGPPPRDGVEWFMDHRNADGTTAEMCGNGIRLFARYLAVHDLLPDGPHAELRVGTRSGVRTIRFAGGDGARGDVAVGMGPATVGETSTASVDGTAFPGIAVDVGNPHLACVTDSPLDDLDLDQPPGFDPALFPHGVNVEFVSPLAGGSEVAMRVHERGVGETRSCGTGTVAAVVAALRRDGRESGTVAVRARGGRLRVTVENGATTLHGPAVLVAHGTLDREWWAGLG